MSGDAASGDLERRYRRWLRAYPNDYRAEREEELVGVLLDASAPGQARPHPAEVLDLVRGGVAARFRGTATPVPLSPWAAAANLVAIVLTLILGVGSLVIGAAIVRASGDDLRSVVDDMSFLPGWFSPWVWTLAAAFLVMGCTRLTAATAWIAVAAQARTIVWILDSSTGSSPYFAVSFVAACMAAVLVSRPASIRRSIASMGQRRIACTALVLACLCGAVDLLHLVPAGSVLLDSTTFTAAVIVGAVCLVPRSDLGGWRHPAVRRAVAVLGALVLFALVGGHRSTDIPFLVRPGDGTENLVLLAAAVTLVWVVVIGLAFGAARRVHGRGLRPPS